MPEEENHGIIHSGLITGSHMLGGINQMPTLMPSADWEEYLPVFEEQRRFSFDSHNCVQFSFLNTCEILSRFYQKPMNRSDRFLYWASGCTDQGNTFENCYLGFKRNGSPDESLWPWVTPLTRTEYGRMPPETVREEAKKLFDEWDIRTPVYVPNKLEVMQEALIKGPLWFCNWNHAMVIYRIDDRIRVFDTYPDSGMGRGSFPLEYVPQIEAAYLVPFTPKAIPMPTPTLKIPQFALVTGVFENGLHRAFFKDGNLYYDGNRSEEALLAWIENNTNPVTHVFSGGPTMQLSRDDWEKFPLVSFKGEPWPYPIP